MAEGKTEGAPDTVLAMLQARLGRLPAPARTLLCAASIFGSVFFRGGVAALLGSAPLAGVDASLAQLVELELVSQSAASRLASEVEYGFRHDLIRDAAYDLLTKEDRVLGHYLAAQFLEQAGEREAVTLAEHYRLGDAPDRAAKWYQRSAEQALDASELGTAQRRAQSAIDVGARGEERGQLYGLQATAAYWLRNDAETRRCAEQALIHLTPGKKDWYFSAAHFLVSCGRLKHWDAVSRQLAVVMSTQPEPAAISALGLCLARTGYMFMMQGRMPQVKQIADELARLSAELREAEPSALAQVDHFRSAHAMLNGDIVSGVQYMEKTIQSFERAQDQRNVLMERNTLACNLIEIGQYQRAEQLTRLNLHECERLKIPAPRSMTLAILGYSLTFFADKQQEARKVLTEALERSRASQHRLHQSWALSALARLSYMEGRFAEVETHALPALEMMRADATTFQTWPLGWLARGYVKQGRLEEGRAFAEQAIASLKALGSFTMAPMVPPLARAEALLALGERDAARQAIESAKRRVLRLADRLTEPSWRVWFLGHPENAATLALPDALPAQCP